MSFDAHKNFARGRVLTAPSPADSGTQLVLRSGEGSRFPTPPFNATVWPSGADPIPENAEIVRVTAKVSDTLTIARAQEGSTARKVLSGNAVAATITARTFSDLEACFASDRIWVDQANGDDATGERGVLGRAFATITAAKAVADIGDLIMVGPGTYAENNLAKAGVRYYFAPGTIIEYNDPGTGAGYGIFDDRAAGAAGEWLIDGFLEIIYRFGPPNGDGTYFLGVPTPRNVNALGAIVVTSSATSVCARLRKIGVSGPVATDDRGAITVKDCSPSFIALEHIYGLDEIWSNPDTEDSASNAANGVYWRKGELHVDCKRTEMQYGYCTWSDDPGSADTNFYFNGQLMKGLANAPVYVTGTNPNYRVWIEAELIQSGGLAVSLIGQGKVYIKAQKVQGVNNVIATNGTELWLEADKLSTTIEWLIMGDDSGGHHGDVHLRVAHYECTSQVANGLTNGSSGTLFVHGGAFKGTASDINCHVCHSNANGKTRLMACLFDNSANSVTPITANQNGLTLMNCAIICGSGASASIGGASGKVVKLFGTNVATKAMATVTAQVGSLTVDANVA